MSSTQMPLLDALRTRTAGRHRTLDASAFTRALTDGTLAPGGYWAMLKATFLIRDSLERTLESHPSPAIASVWTSAFKRASLLETDLLYLERTGVPECPRALQAAKAVVEQARRRADQSPISLLGWLYVMEGSMKGAPFVCRAARRTFGFAGDEGLTYLSSANDAATTWSDFSGRMNALALDDAERESLLEAAVELFDGLIEIFQAIQPDAASLNREAGRHPIPSDPRELAAAERAGDACWRLFPYLDRRYGERGRRFTSSDSAWLVTLAELDQPSADQQVLWLGNVIAARGLPRIILESQLVLLHQELCESVPGRHERYERLRGASHLLHSRRTALLPDAQFDAIAARFETRTGPLHDRVPHVGVLIVSAVLDATDDVPSAVESLTGWLTEPSRFSEAWIRAVTETVAEATGLMPKG